MDDPLLQKAWKLHRHGLFSECVSLLEPAILRYRSVPDFYRILGLSCVRSGDLQGGETYLLRCLQLDPEDRLPVLQALAAVAVRKRDYSGAVKLLLEVLDEDPLSRVAKKALEELNHPNIVQGIDVGRDEATKLWYFAMEFIDGSSLQKILDAEITRGIVCEIDHHLEFFEIENIHSTGSLRRAWNKSCQR
jgi:tetratricopeptide (TPR) repeat protein